MNITIKGNGDRKGRLWQLFWTFFKTGALTFGGGYAMIPMIEREMVENHRWITHQEILDIFAISESTPGPIAVNTATFIGYKIGRLSGSIFATLGVILPSVIIISLLYFVLDVIRDNAIVDAAFSGIRIGVIVLIFGALKKLFKPVRKGIFNYIMILLAFCASLFFGVKSVVILLCAIVLGIGYSVITGLNRGGY